VPFLKWLGEQATASATADPYGMTNKRTDKATAEGRRAEGDATTDKAQSRKDF
jgi:hypothetical protein